MTEEMKHIEAIQQEYAECKLQEQKKEILDFQIKLASALYDKAMAYTNLITMVGYAGFFGLWSITKDNLTPKHVLWSALFMGISLSSFVFFEVGKMIFNSCFMLSRNCALKKLRGENDMEKIIAILKEHDSTMELRNVEFIHFWFIALWIIIPTALIGVSILTYSFIVNLFAQYNHCAP
jgi:hypothetical protein